MNIVNVVATGELSGTVNLEYLFEATEDVYSEYDPVHHQGCYIRFEEEGPLITVYNSGKYIIRAESVGLVKEQNEKLITYLENIGIPEEFTVVSFNVSNIVGHSSIGREINLKALAEDLPYADSIDDAAYRLSFSYPNSNTTISLFRTGKAIIMGSKSVDEANEVWEEFRNDVSELFQKESAG